MNIVPARALPPLLLHFTFFVFATPAAEEIPRCGQGLACRTVTLIPRSDQTEGLLFHEGFLWVGVLSESRGVAHRVELYDRQGRLAHVFPSEARPNFIAALSDREVLYGGNRLYRDGEAWGSGYRIVRDLSVGAPVALPLGYSVDTFTGDASHFFFTEPGGWNQEEATVRVPTFENISKPIGAILTSPGPLEVGGHLSPLPPRFHAPWKMAYTGKKLYLIVRNSIPGRGDDNIARFNFASGNTDWTFALDTRKELDSILFLPETDEVAVSESGADQVLLLSAPRNRVTRALAIPGGRPRGLAAYGHCLVVASQRSHRISFFDLARADAPMLASWDARFGGFTRAERIAVDPRSGQVFVRFIESCPECAHTRSGVVSLTPETSAVRDRCLSRPSVM